MVLPTEKREVEYSTVRTEILTGDLLLYRADWKITNNLISKLGTAKSPYCHTGMAIWCRGVLFVAHMLQGRGGCIESLSSEVKVHPGYWDVFRIENSAYTPQVAANQMLRLVGTKYGWGAIGRALAHKVFPKLVDAKMELDTSLPHCAAAISRVTRNDNFDLVENKSDIITEPGDIADSPDTKYLFTLI